MLYGAGQRQNFWFYGHEGQVYSVRFDSTLGQASLHHPASTATGTSNDLAVLFRLYEKGEGATPPDGVSFEAPLTGWYRLEVRGQPTYELGPSYPSLFTVQFAHAPVHMADYAELPAWGGTSSATCH